MTEWVTAAEFTTEPDAYIAAGMLQDNGIEAVVTPNHMSTLYGAGATWSPVILSVPAAQLAQARRLLHEHRD